METFTHRYTEVPREDKSESDRSCGPTLVSSTDFSVYREPTQCTRLFKLKVLPCIVHLLLFMGSVSVGLFVAHSGGPRPSLSDYGTVTSVIPF